MKDLFLIPIMLAVFVFGYFVMAKIDSFIEENRRLIHAENRQNRAHIRIAAESPMLLDSIAVQLTAYSRANPFVEFFLSSGKAERVLQKLIDGTLDIAILAEDNNLSLNENYSMFRIPCPQGPGKSFLHTKETIMISSIDEEKWAFVVWNKSIQSKSRDRVLFAIEAEYCSLKCGYADYLE